MEQKVKNTKNELYRLGRKLGLNVQNIDNILVCTSASENFYFANKTSPIDMYKGGGGGWYSTISINNFQ